MRYIITLILFCTFLSLQAQQKEITKKQNAKYPIDTVICVKGISYEKSQIYWPYLLPKSTKAERDAVIFGDSTYNIKLYEKLNKDKCVCEYTFYMNGNIRTQECKYKRPIIDTSYTSYHYYYNGDIESSYINNKSEDFSYNYKGNLSSNNCIFCPDTKPDINHYSYYDEYGPYHMSIVFYHEDYIKTYNEQPNELVKIMVPKMHLGGFVEETGEKVDLHAYGKKLDSLRYYKQIETLFIYIDEGFNQDSLIKDKLAILPKLPNLREISLCGPGFTHIPEEIYRCKRLEVMAISNTNIMAISPKISKLDSLYCIILNCKKNFNYAQCFEFLGKLPHLRSLHILYDLNQEISQQINNCKNLKVLRILPPFYFGLTSETIFTPIQVQNLEFLSTLEYIKYKEIYKTSEEQINYIKKKSLQNRKYYFDVF